ncbi:Zinc finger mynd domain-containing protein 15-like [Plakobranchus ocellatus]|uniref:Zinc finger mynd domain-containing protein 15-like n=1 Tax=Plakobranchus ocellatus TaxID=259542 RepID=A0AAV4BF87_9GAST|nr:Zinc finger mynd domain-containing protein 15-like [Plakobranchus ocellatus]
MYCQICTAGSASCNVCKETAWQPLIGRSNLWPQPAQYHATCSNTFDHKAQAAFLMERGLYGKGLWKHLCPETLSKGLTFGTICLDEPFVLPKESSVLQSSLPSSVSLDEPLKTWLEYFTLRGFELDSPIAGLLHYPLTLYWIITTWLAKMYPGLYEKMKCSGNICVHVIGAEKEADMFPAFVECGRLLAPVKLHIHLFGDEIAKEVDGQSHSQDNVSFNLHSNLYHESYFQPQMTPDIVVAVRTKVGQATQEFLERRRQMWLKALNRKGLDFNTVKPNHRVRVCSDHFVSGQPSFEQFETDPDWVPYVHVGHNQQRDVDALPSKHERAEGHRKRKKDAAAAAAYMKSQIKEKDAQVAEEYDIESQPSTSTSSVQEAASQTDMTGQNKLI